MSDRTRDRYNPANGRIEVSKVFDWYCEDVTLGHRGISSLPAFLARYAGVLADASDDRECVRSQQATVTFLPYDWKLNEAA